MNFVTGKKGPTIGLYLQKGTGSWKESIINLIKTIARVQVG